MKPGQLLAEAARLAGIPGLIVQGRYDLLCPPATSHALAAVWPDSKVRLVEGAGHSLYDPGVRDAVMRAIADLASEISAIRETPIRIAKYAARRKRNVADLDGHRSRRMRPISTAGTIASISIERVAIDGFLEARRYIAHQGSPKYLCLYSTETFEVLDSPAYRTG